GVGPHRPRIRGGRARVRPGLRARVRPGRCAARIHRLSPALVILPRINQFAKRRLPPYSYRKGAPLTGYEREPGRRSFPPAAVPPACPPGKDVMSTSSIMQETPLRSGRRAALRDRRGLALAIVLGAQLMIILDMTVVNIALPSIAHGLHFSATGLSWVLNAYTLTFGGLLLLGGRAGDILGRRQVFRAGIALFTAASLAGGLAQTGGWLLAARAAQGVGGAFASPAVLAMITASFADGRERARALGIYTAVVMGGGSLGLVLGGVITEWVSWRWVLFINVPIGVLVVLASPLFLPVTPRQPGH